MGRKRSDKPSTKASGEPEGRRRLNGKMVALLAAGLFIFIVFVRDFAEGMDELRRGEEARFEKRSEHLESAIDRLDPLVPAESPAQPFLDSARFAHAFAAVEADHSIKVAQQRLTEGYTYLCDAKAVLNKSSCGPPDHDALQAVLNHPATPVTLTLLGAVGSAIGTWFANFHSVAKDFLGRRGGGGK